MENKHSVLQESLLEAYNKFEQCYLLKRDLKATLDCIEKELTGYGTGDNEDLSEKGSYPTLFERDMRTVPDPIISRREYAKADLITDNIGIINTVFHVEAKNPEGDTAQFKIRASHLFVHDGKEWKMRHLHASEPSVFQQMDEAYAFQALKEKNIELEHLVGRRTYELQKALESRDLIMKEVHHRIKNNMSTIHALLSLHSRNAEAKAADALNDAASRIKSMMTLYDFLYRNEKYQDMNAADYLRQLAKGIRSSFIDNDSNIKIFENIDDAILPVDDVFYIGILANELLINACKHAYTDGKAGSIYLTFLIKKDKLWILSVADDGIPMPDFDDKPSGFGFTLIRTIATQLRARLEIVPQDRGKKIIIVKTSSII